MNVMNKVLFYSILTILVCIGIYLLGSFIVWDFNPKKWNDEGRGVAAFMALMFSGILIVSNEEKI